MRDGNLIFLALLIIGFFAVAWGYFTALGQRHQPAPLRQALLRCARRATPAARSPATTRRRAPCASGLAAPLSRPS